ncbi:MAG TPA: hypothetical protein VLC09_14595, partial [Polyangiaceae bacterium]|nr:hypothetical protein [Polyangiaceae bacterium]
RFRPHGLQFDEDVDIELQAEKKRPEVKVVKLSDERDPTWEVVGKKRPDSNQIVAVKVRSFSIYALVYDPEGVLPDLGPVEPSGTGGGSGLGGESGTGGNGGTIGLPNGYFDNGTWRGFGELILSGGATGTSDLDSKSAPHCISGTTESTGDSWAELSYHLQESKAGGDNKAVPGLASGLEFDLSTNPERIVRVMLYAGTVGFCYETYVSGTTIYAPYAEFFTDCNSEGGAVYEGQNLDRIAFQIPSRGAPASDPYGLCVERFADSNGLQPGYMEGQKFYGYTGVNIAGQTDVTSTSFTDTFPAYCIDGTMGAGAGNMTQFILTVNQSRANEAAVPVVPTEAGLLVSFSAEDSLKRYAFIGGPSGDWCAPLLDNYSVIPWAEFRQFCDGTGAGYAMQPLDAVWIYVPTRGQVEPIHYCVDELDQATLTHVGYWSFGSQFSGYASLIKSDLATAISSVNRASGAGSQCARGSLPIVGDASEFARIQSTVSETTEHVASVFNPIGTGLIFDYDDHLGSTPLTAYLIDDSGVTFCASVSTSGAPIQYSQFNTGCGTGPGTPYSGSSIASVGLGVIADSSVALAFDYCLWGVNEQPVMPQ